MKASNNPQKAILEAEQKFGGYSFCHLGRDKGRKAKKQKRKTRIGENESAHCYVSLPEGTSIRLLEQTPYTVLLLKASTLSPKALVP